MLLPRAALPSPNQTLNQKSNQKTSPITEQQGDGVGYYLQPTSNSK
jgi:hypothetical protein